MKQPSNNQTGGTGQMAVRPESLLVKSPLLRVIYQVLAVCCIILGIIGAILPVMPTTVFLLIAAWLSVRSSPAINDWLLGHPLFGPSLKSFLQNRCISKNVFMKAVFLLWLGMALSVWWVPVMWLKILLLMIGFSVTTYLYVLMRRGKNKLNV